MKKKLMKMKKKNKLIEKKNNSFNKKSNFDGIGNISSGIRKINTMNFKRISIIEEKEEDVNEK